VFVFLPYTQRRIIKGYELKVYKVIKSAKFCKRKDFRINKALHNSKFNIQNLEFKKPSIIDFSF